MVDVYVGSGSLVQVFDTFHSANQPQKHTIRNLRGLEVKKVLQVKVSTPDTHKMWMKTVKVLSLDKYTLQITKVSKWLYRAERLAPRTHSWLTQGLNACFSQSYQTFHHPRIAQIPSSSFNMVGNKPLQTPRGGYLFTRIFVSYVFANDRFGGIFEKK